MTLALLAESALRSLLLGACVFALVKLMRLRDSRSETMIWTLVLLASLAMPFLARALPGGIAVTMPHLPVSGPVRFAAAGQATLGIALVALHPAATPDALAQLTMWCGAHGRTLLWSLYGLVALLGLARLLAGLLLTLRLYRAARPLEESWGRGRVRASQSIGGPLSFGRHILLPDDYRGWSAAKLAAVLAHEEAHVARGDFFIQLLAAAHRALFWFSPFAWWLEARLRELAETASDDAAIRRLADAEGYAEILIDVSRQAAQRGAMVAMARGPGIAKRIDHILSSDPERSLGLAGRAAVLAAVLAAGIAVAGAHAAIPAVASAIQPLPVARAAAEQPPSAAAPQLEAATPLPPSRASLPQTHRRARIAEAPPEDDVTYNPRALLEEFAVAVLPVIVPMNSGGSGKNKQPGNAIIFAPGPED